MANISLTLYTNGFIGSVLMSPIQMGSLRVNNSVTNISRLGTFNVHCHSSDYGDALYNVHEQKTQLRTAALSCGQLSGGRELWAAEDS
jgi:hypothetical protein